MDIKRRELGLMNKHISCLEEFRKKYPQVHIYSSSLQETKGKLYFLVKKEGEKFVVIGEKEFKFLPINQKTIELLCENLPYLKPRKCGLGNSFGFGDRLGVATPGHIRAVLDYNFFPVFAQQSVRELERTRRNFNGVLHDAILGCFQEGYRKGFGAEADHIKDFANLKKAMETGFTFFVIDPSDEIKAPSYIKNEEGREIFDKHFKKYEKLYLGKVYQIANNRFEFNHENLSSLVLTYGEAIDFVEECYKLIQGKISSFDFEVSVDETSLPTTPLAHILIVEELRRRKIDFQNIALRFPGKFEKAIDYIGSVEEFERILVIHQAIREKFGPYKISLHSGSDKFKIYPIFKKVLRDNFHVKTSGTSWIEAVKAIAECDFEFFLEILNLAIETFEVNVASYEISASPNFVNLEAIKKEDVEQIFEDNNIRQIIHISYGSILSDNDLRDKFYKVLGENEEEYSELLKKHLGKHLKLLT